MKVTDKYVLFWDGVFSNWYPSPMEINGTKFNCVEQYMMYQKAMLFGDTETAALIMEARPPREQKALGRKVQNYNEQAWAEARLDIVTTGCTEKFLQNEELLEHLLRTQDKILVEASPYDKVWGIGLGEDNPLALNESTWQGQNLLGIALMQARDNIKQLGAIE